MSDDELADAIAQDFGRAVSPAATPAPPQSGPEAAPPTAVSPQDAAPPRPRRRSLPVDVLATTLAAEAEGAGGTLEAMARLEEQLTLLEQDAREFTRWQESMLSKGTPESLAAVDSARAEFQDILPSPSQPPPAALQTPSAPQIPSASQAPFSAPAPAGIPALSAPPPASAPYSDIPPPPGQAGAGAPTAGPMLHDLVEPQAQADLLDSDIADTDRAFAGLDGLFPVDAEGVAIAPGPPVAPVSPMASPRIPADEHVLLEEPPAALPAFRVEQSATEPTPLDRRAGNAVRMFWMWFAAHSSVVSLAFGGAVFSLGMSLRQAILATLVGVAVSFLPLGLGTLAGKWSGQPTMIVSRASFGVIGNLLPAMLALVVRLFWGAVLLWFLAAGTARILVGAELGGPLSEPQLTIIALAVGLVLALVMALFGHGLIARAHAVITILSAALIVGFIVITLPVVSIQTALTTADGPWILIVTGGVLVFSFVGLVWAVSSADLARYQRPGGSGAASMLWATFGAAIPAFVLIAYGAVLAASNPGIATGLIENPLDTIALLLPIWYPVPLVAALALSLLSGVVLSIYSGGLALQATGAGPRRSISVVIVALALGALGVVLALSVSDLTLLLRDVATTLAVPVAAWAGIFAAEMMIRNRRFDSDSLLRRGGIYPAVNWLNLSMLLVASAIGFGTTTATLSWLSWQGYLFPFLGISLGSDIAASDLGVLVALLLGLLTPIIAGIPTIRRQERAAEGFASRGRTTLG